MDTQPQPEDRTISIGSTQVRYWAEGQLGEPVLLIHGLGGYVEWWRLTIPALALHRRVYAVDLPGFGKTDKPANYPYNISAFVQFIADFMAALGLDHASLVGHSLGGAVALQLALTFPRAVDRLVLLSSAGLGRELTILLRLASLPIVGEQVSKPSLAGSRWFLENTVCDKSLVDEESVRVDYELSLRPGTQQAFLKTLRSGVNVFGQKRSFYGPIVDKLAEITQPALVLWGREDAIVPVEHAQVACRMPNARLRIFERCSHCLQLEQPSAFNQELGDFLSG